ncbi:MAG: hypothetical protein PHU49_00440 [Syntrophorhabdaceae bacterium]|nr:hypothetical protein [Syntrophorhabdaceae bacterium]
MNFYDEDFGEEYLMRLEIEKVLSQKKEKDLLEELLAKPELIIGLEPEKPPEPIAEYFTGKIDSLKERISNLNQEIDARFQFKKKFLQEIDYQIRESAFSLSQFHWHSVGYNKGIDQLRLALQRQLSSLRRDRRAVELKAWADIVNIRKELRRTLEEYKDAIRRYRIVE